MFRRISYLIVVCAVVGVWSEIDISPCKVGDDECIKSSMNLAIPEVVKGIPSLKIESSEPLVIQEITGDVAELKYKFNNAVIKGLGKCVVQKATLKMEKNSFHLDIMCPVLNMHGDYKIDGNMLGMAIQGEGLFHIDSKKSNYIVDMEIKRAPGKDGKDHIVVKNYKLKAEVLGGVVFDFKNLFKGDKALSDAVHKFANANWKEVSEQFQGPVFNGLLKKLMTNVSKFLKSVPIDRLLIE